MPPRAGEKAVVECDHEFWPFLQHHPRVALRPRHPPVVGSLTPGGSPGDRMAPVVVGIEPVAAAPAACGCVRAVCRALDHHEPVAVAAPEPVEDLSDSRRPRPAAAPSDQHPAFGQLQHTCHLALLCQPRMRHGHQAEPGAARTRGAPQPSAALAALLISLAVRADEPSGRPPPPAAGGGAGSGGQGRALGTSAACGCGRAAGGHAVELVEDPVALLCAGARDLQATAARLVPGQAGPHA